MGFATSGTTLNTRFIRGPGVDEIVANYASTGPTPAQYWAADERGSLVNLSNGTTGANTIINTYDEYGGPAPSNLGRLQYTGQLWMPDFGTYHYKARAYQPGLGRFLQTDPIGYEAGANLYAYVGGDPVNWVDSTGLQASQVDDVVVTGSRHRRLPLAIGTSHRPNAGERRERLEPSRTEINRFCRAYGALQAAATALDSVLAPAEAGAAGASRQSLSRWAGRLFSGPAKAVSAASETVRFVGEVRSGRDPLVSAAGIAGRLSVDAAAGVGGGIVGGIIGEQVGGDWGQLAGTILGGALGGIVADQLGLREAAGDYLAGRAAGVQEGDCSQ